MKSVIGRLPPKQKVLVVDDEEALRLLLAHELTLKSFEVLTAGDGEEAIKIVRKKKEQGEEFDVVILDIKMPKVDGWQALKYIKTSTPRTKVIILTAYGDVKNAIEAMRLGASDFVGKPYDLHDILTSIDRALAG